MSGPAPYRAISRIAWLVAIVAAAPLLVFAYPPMTDLPYHEDVVAVLRNVGDASKTPPGVYELQLGRPNQLFYLLAWPLAYLVPVTTACKVVTAGGVAGVVLGYARLLRHLGASPWLSVLAVPLAIGWLFNWGFVTNLLGLGLLLAVLPRVDAFMTRPSWQGALVVIALGVLVDLGHQLMFLAMLAACGLLLLLARRPRRKLLVRASVPLVLGGGTALEFLLRSRSFAAGYARPGATASLSTTWDGLVVHLAELPAFLVGKQALLAKVLLMVSWIAVAIAFAHRGDPRTWSLRSRRARFAVLAAVYLLAFFVVPQQWNAARHLYPRFFAPAVLVGAAALARRDRRAPRPLVRVLAALVPFGMLVTVLPDFVESSGIHSRARASLAPLLARIPLRASVAYLDVDASDPGLSMTPLLSARGGRVVPVFHETGGVLPVRIAPEAQWSDLVVRVGENAMAFTPAHDFRHVELAVVHAAHPDAVFPFLERVLQPWAALVAREGEWALFRSKLPVIPPATHELPMPASTPATLAALVRGDVSPASPPPAAR